MTCAIRTPFWNKTYKGCSAYSQVKSSQLPMIDRVWLLSLLGIWSYILWSILLLLSLVRHNLNPLIRDRDSNGGVHWVNSGPNGPEYVSFRREIYSIMEVHMVLRQTLRNGKCQTVFVWWLSRDQFQKQLVVAYRVVPKTFLTW